MSKTEHRLWWLPDAVMVVGLFVLALYSGCGMGTLPGGVPLPPGTSIGGKPEAEGSKPKTVEQLEQELAQAKKKAAEADSKVEEVKRQLDDARVISRQKKLWWVSGICVIALLGCIAGAIFLPGAARYFVSGALASAVVGVAAYCLAWLMPYMPWVMAGFAVVALGVVIWLWRRDHMGLRSVVSAVEGVKAEIPGYRDKFKRYVNGSTDLYVNKVREKLNLKPKGGD